MDKREAAQSEPQHASASVVKPGLSTQYMLVLAGTANLRVDSVVWLEVHAAQLPSFQCGFVHYNFDESIKPLALLDLLTRVQAHFSQWPLFYHLVRHGFVQDTQSQANSRFGLDPIRLGCKTLQETTMIAFNTPTKLWRYHGGFQRLH